MNLYIGLMSGTSMDGIDAALVDVSTNTLIAGVTRPYSTTTQQLLRDVLNQTQTSIATYSQLNILLGREFAQAVTELLSTAAVSAQQVVAIGSHGQTIAHDPNASIPYTVQLGCAHTIAALTGITVVADFRARDVVLGGQGAPFAPIYHQALFSGLNSSTAIVNIGGIANATFLNQQYPVSGYDTGPGNGLMDDWIYKHLGQRYDKNGEWGATGKIIEPLLKTLLTDSYFQKPIPKSLDKSWFSNTWLAQHLHSDYAHEDVQATLRAFTAMSIADAIKSYPIAIQHVAICGGGVHNVALMADIRRQLPGIQVDSTQVLGVDPDFIEAMMFAWFADKTIQRIPVDLTPITGAEQPTILGAIYPV